MMKEIIVGGLYKHECGTLLRVLRVFSNGLRIKVLKNGEGHCWRVGNEGDMWIPNFKKHFSFVFEEGQVWKHKGEGFRIKVEGIKKDALRCRVLDAHGGPGIPLYEGVSIFSLITKGFTKMYDLVINEKESNMLEVGQIWEFREKNTGNEWPADTFLRISENANTYGMIQADILEDKNCRFGPTGGLVELWPNRFENIGQFRKVVEVAVFDQGTRQV